MPKEYSKVEEDTFLKMHFVPLDYKIGFLASLDYTLFLAHNLEGYANRFISLFSSYGAFERILILRYLCLMNFEIK